MNVEGIEYDPQEGDILDFHPALASKFISEFLAQGIDFWINGNKIVVETVPGSSASKKEEVTPEIEAIVATTIEAIEAEELSPAENLAAVEEVAVEEAPKSPVKRGRKPKVQVEDIPAPVVEEE